MNDVKDILGVKNIASSSSKTVTTPRPKAPPFEKKEKKKKTTRLDREVHQLLQAEKVKPSLAPTVPLHSPPRSSHALKQKLKLSTHTDKWEWKPFRNSARSDGAVFYHWSKSSNQETDYPFARFNKKLTIPHYTDEQYAKYFEDPNWTREETDTLFDLCRRFDLRFVVIHDRWPLRPKTIEELKERYYTIARMLLQMDESTDPENPLLTYPLYNKDQDMARRKQLEKLWLRTPEQAAEEDHLLSELERLHHGFASHRKEAQKIIKMARKTLANFSGVPPKDTLPHLNDPTLKIRLPLSIVRTVLQMQSPISDNVQCLGATTAATSNINTNTNRSTTNELQTLSTTSDTNTSSNKDKDRLPSAFRSSTISSSLISVGSSTQPPTTKSLPESPSPIGCVLSSPSSAPATKSNKTSLQARLTSALEQLGLKTSNLKSSGPQSPLFAPLNELKNDLLILFELQKLYSEMLYELEVVRAQHALYTRMDTNSLNNGDNNIVVVTNSQTETNSNTILTNGIATDELIDSTYSTVTTFSSSSPSASLIFQSELPQTKTKKKSSIRNKERVQILRRKYPRRECRKGDTEMLQDATLQSEEPNFETPQSLTRLRRSVDDISSRDELVEENDDSDDNDNDFSANNENEDGSQESDN